MSQHEKNTAQYDEQFVVFDQEERFRQRLQEKLRGLRDVHDQLRVVQRWLDSSEDSDYHQQALDGFKRRMLRILMSYMTLTAERMYVGSLARRYLRRDREDVE